MLNVRVTFALLRKKAHAYLLSITWFRFVDNDKTRQVTAVCETHFCSRIVTLLTSPPRQVGRGSRQSGCGGNRSVGLK